MGCGHVALTPRRWVTQFNRPYDEFVLPCSDAEPAVFAAAANRARTMTIDEAVEYALAID